MTLTTRRATLFLAALAFLFASAHSATAATITWSPPVAISSVGDSIVSTSGSLVQALHFGQSANYTVNGVLFDGQAPTTNGVLSNFAALGNSSVNANFYQDGNVSTDFESILDSFAWQTSASSTSIVLKNLNPTTTYHVQFFVSNDSDTSPSGASNYETTFTAGNSSIATAGHVSFSLIGTFTADSSSQIISIANTLPPSTPSSPYVNGYQLRTGIVPEPATLVLAVFGIGGVFGLGFMAHRHRQG